MQTMALYFFVSASVREMLGISKAPGTRTMSMASFLAPSCRSACKRAREQAFGDEGVEARDDNREAHARGVQVSFDGLVAPILVVGKDRKLAGAGGHFDGEEVRAPVEVLHFVDDLDAVALCLRVQFVGVVAFEDKVGIGKAFAEAEFDARFRGVEFHAFAALAVPGLAMHEAESVEEGEEGLVFVVGFGDEQLVD